MRRGSRFVPLLVVLAGWACTTPTTRPPTITPEQVRAEQRKQRVLVLEKLYGQQERLDRIAYPLLTAARPFCGDDAMPWPGFRVLFAEAFPEEWRDAAREAYALGDTLRVFSVTPGGPAERAGIRPGDRVVRVADHDVGTGAQGARRLFGWLWSNLAELDTLTVRMLRDGRALETHVALEPACAYETVVVPSLALNAFADGSAVYVTSGMMRFAEDDELASIVAHEIAHNARGHLDAAMRNATLAGLFGLIGDIATLVAGDTLPEVPYSVYFADRGARAFSRDFEREADYVGLYILARAGHPLEGAPRIFREFAVAEPDVIDYSGTHPTHAERFLLMEAAIREIEGKRERGEPLEPEAKRE
ncbi:MAG: M48 family metalloprotease [Gemmatimonadetes bacterium]|nr:M48 family metalloprotease [Gemmatimonadota bacterium]NIQ58847.1 M48 family metalloprotease [Gemmatimonadota bacterium]NIU79015.1 M48 family metalloprotease [Gammaproteobacteria bacterium]NIX47759.1 M48 family metalloprotease [Gemmatimonadota bacterium]NIY12117.1 M48 family metalloprotease [Gemmatimonadota bacterium]